MLVKAKWNVKGSDGWHFGGEVFNTEENFGDAVEVIEQPVSKPKKEAVEEPAKEPVSEEPKAEKPKSTRRRTTAK